MRYTYYEIDLVKLSNIVSLNVLTSHVANEILSQYVIYKKVI
jgi:hypothetical protein